MRCTCSKLCGYLIAPHFQADVKRILELQRLCVFVKRPQCIRRRRYAENVMQINGCAYCQCLCMIILSAERRETVFEIINVTLLRR